MSDLFLDLTDSSDVLELAYAPLNGAIVRGLAGDDRIEGTLGEAESINGNSGNDTLIGWGASDTIYGGQGDDVIYAGYPNTPYPIDGVILAIYEQSPVTLRGNAGNDFISGGNGNDSVEGNDGNDTLIGGDGNDTILGGLGDDLLTGGRGVDVFLLSSAFEMDTIADFDTLEDRILILTAEPAGQEGDVGLAAGNQAAESGNSLALSQQEGGTFVSFAGLTLFVLNASLTDVANNIVLI